MAEAAGLGWIRAPRFDVRIVHWSRRTGRATTAAQSAAKARVRRKTGSDRTVGYGSVRQSTRGSRAIAPTMTTRRYVETWWLTTPTELPIPAESRRNTVAEEVSGGRGGSDG